MLFGAVTIIPYVFTISICSVDGRAPHYEQGIRLKAVSVPCIDPNDTIKLQGMSLFSSVNVWKVR